MKKSNSTLDEQLLGVSHQIFNGGNGYENQEFLLFISSAENLELKALNTKGVRYFKNCFSEELNGNCFYEEVVHPEDYPFFVHYIQSCAELNEGEEKEMTLRMRSPFGHWKKFHFRTRIYNGFNQDNSGKSLFSLAKAIDPYKNAFRKGPGVNLETEKSLQESVSRYRVLINSLDDGFCIIELIFDMNKRPVDYLFVEINPAFERHIHLDGILGKTMKELSYDHGEKWFQTYADVAKSGHPVRFEKYAKDLEVWFDVYAFPIGSSKNRKVAILCSDITDRKEAEESLRKMNETLESKVRKRTSELKEKNDMLQMVFDTVNQGIFMLKPLFGENRDIIDFTYVRVNKRIRRYYGLDDLVGRRFLEINPQIRKTGAFEIFKQTMLTGKSKDFEVCFTREGKKNWFRLSTRRQKGMLVNSLENVTRQKRRAQSLKESIRFKKQLIETSPDVILIINLYEEKIRFMNRDFSANPMLSRENVEGMHLLDVLPMIHPQHREEAIEFHNKLLKASDRDVVDFEFCLKSQDGEWNYYNARAKVFMRNKKGNPYEYIVMLRNVQEQKRTQQALMKAENLSIKGEIARTLAHELRSPLASIGMSADILDRKLGEPMKKEVQNYINIIKRSNSTLNNLVTELLTSSSYSPSVLKKCCLAETTDLVLDQAKDRIYLAGIKVIRAFKKPLFIQADQDKLKIALLNIIVNASEAMTPNEGVLRVSIKKFDDHYRMVVKDNGCGMEKHQIDKLFESFYTNRAGGLGIGLSSVKNILQEHHATVEVESAPGKGTSFVLVFPCYQDDGAN